MKKNLRKELKKAGGLLDRKGLVAGSCGNISAREGNIVFLKASGVSLCEAKEKNFIGVSLSKSWDKVPGLTSEYRMHRECYLRRKDIKAVIHTHSPYATAIASANMKLKPMTVEFQLLIGNKISRLKRLPYGTQKLAAAVGRTIKDCNCNAVLLSNHGVVALGKSLQEALNRALAVEENAKIQFIYSMLKKKG